MLTKGRGMAARVLRHIRESAAVRVRGTRTAVSLRWGGGLNTLRAPGSRHYTPNPGAGTSRAAGEFYAVQ